MTWTCEETEARLSDYLDGLLEPAEQAAFDHHVNACARCAPLVASVSHVLGSLRRLEPVEPSARLVNSILTVTQGPQTWRNAKRWLRGLQSPRFVYSAVSVAATIALLLTATGFNWRRPKLADLAPAMRQQTIPQSSPKKEPGHTENSNPSSPKQQNRADEFGRNLRVLACEFPTLSGALVDRRVP